MAQQPASHEDETKVLALEAEVSKLRDDLARETLNSSLDMEALTEIRAFVLRFVGMGPSTIDTLVEVGKERLRQDRKWGVQNLPDGTGGDGYVKAANRARGLCEAAFKDKKGTYKHILLEEVAEAMAESDETKLSTELIQVAAVAVAWVECIQRRIQNRKADAQTQQG